MPGPTTTAGAECDAVATTAATAAEPTAAATTATIGPVTGAGGRRATVAPGVANAVLTRAGCAIRATANSGSILCASTAPGGVGTVSTGGA